MLAVIVASMRCRFDGYESAADWIQLLPIEVGHSFSYAQTAVCQCFPKAHEQDLSAPTAVDIAGMDYRRTRPQSGSESFGNRDRREILRGTRSDHEKTMQILATLDQYTGCVLSTPGPSNTGVHLLRSHRPRERRGVGPERRSELRFATSVVTTGASNVGGAKGLGELLIYGRESARVSVGAGDFAEGLGRGNCAACFRWDCWGLLRILVRMRSIAGLARRRLPSRRGSCRCARDGSRCPP